MGRELKRVPLTFNWPLNERWEGYVNPHPRATSCVHCDGSGNSPEYLKLQALWYSHLGGGFTPEMRGSTPFKPDDPVVVDLIRRKISQDNDSRSYYYAYGRYTEDQAIAHEAARMCAIWNSSWSHHLNKADIRALVNEGRLLDLTHTWKSGRGYRWKGHKVRYPTPRQVNEWSLQGMTHDSINRWIVIKAECARKGLPSECRRCKGHGSKWESELARETYDGWESYEPPKGDAYQIWETVTEGSPISPPFATPEELATHMATTRWGADHSTSYETWLAFIRGPGWAPSLMGTAGSGLMTGVEAVVEFSSQS